MRTPLFWHSPNLIAMLLSPLSCVYAMIVSQRQKRAQSWLAPVPVICVGNVVAGGAGKTPTVLMLHRYFQGQGVKAHIISRGYKGSMRGPVKVDWAKHTAAEVGDEPLLIAHHAPCWVAKDRRAGIQAAIQAGAHIILMDDGLQNFSVKKTVSILVMDGEYGLGNGRIIPAGPLRESMKSALGRVQAVVVVGEDRHRLRTIINDITVVQAALCPNHPEHAARGRYVAFAGIGRPEKFFATLRNIGAEVVEAVSFADHHPFSEAELNALAKKAELQQAVLITTEKDFFRLPKEWQKRVKTLPVSLVIEEQVALEKLLATVLATSKITHSR